MTIGRIQAGLSLIVFLVVAGCRDDANPVGAYRHLTDKMKVLTGLAAFFPPCTTRDAFGYTFTGNTDCYRLSAPRLMHGVWIDEFEGSQFEDEQAGPAPSSRAASTWLEMPPPLSPRLRVKVDRGPHRWRITFVGRASLYPGHYGHFGMFDRLVIVDRLISASLIAAR